MSIFGKAAHFIGKAKGTGGFGFKDKVSDVSKKMYGYGQKPIREGSKWNRGQAAAIGGGALLGGAVMSKYGVDYSDMEGIANHERSMKRFQIAIRREIEPPSDQGRDRHLDNLKAIKEHAESNPEHFANFMEMLSSSDDGAAFKNKLRNSFAEYKDEDMINRIGQ